jgi:hypothetical protein
VAEHGCRASVPAPDDTIGVCLDHGVRRHGAIIPSSKVPPTG